MTNYREIVRLNRLRINNCRITASTDVTRQTAIATLQWAAASLVCSPPAYDPGDGERLPCQQSGGKGKPLRGILICDIHGYMAPFRAGNACGLMRGLSLKLRKIPLPYALKGGRGSGIFVRKDAIGGRVYLKIVPGSGYRTGAAPAGAEKPTVSATVAVLRL